MAMAMATTMMRRSLAALCLAGALGYAGAASAQADDPLARLSWMVGAWQGKGLGFDLETWILPERNGEMLVTFTEAKDGKVSRYEFRRMSVADGKGVTQEMAWVADMAPAPKVPLRKIASTSESRADFSGIDYVKSGPNTLTVTLSFPPKDGKPNIVKFDLTREFAFVAP